MRSSTVSDLYNTIVIGSGYYSVAYALNHEKTLIIEETQLLDPNFCARLCSFEMDANQPNSPDAKSLFGAFRGEGLLKAGCIAVNELETAFCRFVQGRELNVLLGTVCLEIREHRDGFAVDICNNDGISTLYAKTIIDARVPRGDQLNFLVCTPDSAPPAVEEIHPAFYPDQFRISAPFPGVADINEAKMLALETHEAALAEVGARIILMAYQLDGAPIQQPYTDDNGILHVDERAFGNVFAAYQEGEIIDGAFHT